MQGVFELSFFADGRLIIPIPPAERLSFLHSTAFTFGSKLAVSVQVYSEHLCCPSRLLCTYSFAGISLDYSFTSKS